MTGGIIALRETKPSIFFLLNFRLVRSDFEESARYSRRNIETGGDCGIDVQNSSWLCFIPIFHIRQVTNY